jgi:hypothetical protein
MLKQTVSESGPVFLLQPSNPSAAPLEAQVDSGQGVTFCPGRNGMTYEVYSHDVHELEEEARLLARAVVEGAYRERIHRRPPDEAVAGWPPDELQAIAEWPTPDGTASPRYNVIRTPRAGAPGWERVSYEPY